MPTAGQSAQSGGAFGDARGLCSRIVGQRICAQLGVRMTVCNPSPFAARLLEVSGVRDRLVDPQWSAS